MVFDKQFFIQHQKKILWLANAKFGRWMLRIHGNKSSVGKNKIVRIEPNSITWVGSPISFVSEFRTHNKFSKRLYFSLRPLWYLLHTWDIFVDAFVPKFSFGFSTLTQYPSSIGTNNPIDGAIRSSNATYLTARNATTGDATDSTTDPVGSPRQEFTGGTYYVNRWVDDFDTSSMGVTSQVISAVKSIWVTSLTGNTDSDTYNVVSNTISSSTALATSDFGSFGSTSFASVALSAIITGQYTDFTLSTAGVGIISVGGITRFGARLSRDLAGTAPTGDSGTNVSQSDHTGTSQDPKLVVTYTTLGSSNINIDNSVLTNNGSDGVALNNTDSVSITNTNIRNNLGWGVTMDAGSLFTHIIGDYLRGNISGTTNNLGLTTVYANNTEL